MTIRNPYIGTAEATVLAENPREDHAVLLSLAAPPAFARFAEMFDWDVGDPVYAFGHPLGGDMVVNYGRIVANPDGRETGSGSVAIDEFIETSIEVKPGFSGGPLVDSRGLVIGSVAARLDVERLRRETGRDAAPRAFVNHNLSLMMQLQVLSVPFERVPHSPQLAQGEIVGEARKYVVKVICEID